MVGKNLVNNVLFVCIYLFIVDIIIGYDIGVGL